MATTDTNNTQKSLDSNSTTETWQTISTRLKDKLTYMLKHQISTDVELKVGTGNDTETIRCHRLVLIMNSPVFESMFSERWLNDKGLESTKICLPEIDSKVARIILKVISHLASFLHL